MTHTHTLSLSHTAFRFQLNLPRRRDLFSMLMLTNLIRAYTDVKPNQKNTVFSYFHRRRGQVDGYTYVWREFSLALVLHNRDDNKTTSLKVKCYMLKSNNPSTSGTIQSSHLYPVFLIGGLAMKEMAGTEPSTYFMYIYR